VWVLMLAFMDYGAERERGMLVLFNLHGTVKNKLC